MRRAHRRCALAAMLTWASLAAPASAADDVLESVEGEEVKRLLSSRTNVVVVYTPDGRRAQVRFYGNATRPRAPLADVEDESRNADADNRSEALHRLAGTPEGLQAALDVLARERTVEVLKTALDVLATYETAPLEPILKFVASEDRDLRIHALEVLAWNRRRDPRVDTVLRRAAASDGDEAVRETARGLLESRD